MKGRRAPLIAAFLVRYDNVLVALVLLIGALTVFVVVQADSPLETVQAVRWVLIIVGWVLFIWIVIAIGEIGHNVVQAEKRRRSEAIDNFIAEHQQALARKRRQMVQRDAYGNENTKKWDGEKKYFIETTLLPHLSNLGYNFSDDSIELDQAVERFARSELARASSSITDVTTGHEYEHFCARLLSESGWDARVTKASGDQGADIIAHYDSLCVVFQCKFYTSPVGNKAVQEAVAARMHEQADLAVVISNATYTKSAEELAETTKTILINHDDIPALKEIIRRRRAAINH